MIKNSKKGFTLVELSIVLVIIGLLIGGILVAQSMINTTKIQAVVRQLAQFDSAVANFDTKYNALPGDTTKILASVANMDGSVSGKANGDGKLRDYATTTVEFDGEIGSFWHALTLSGYSTGGSTTTFTQIDDTATQPVINTHIPAAKCCVPDAGFVAFSNITANIATAWYALVSAKGQYTAGSTIDFAAAKGAVKAADALAIDVKIDDGVANAGYVKSGSASVASGLAPATPDPTCSTTTTYAVSDTTFACVPMIRIGLSTGTLK